MKKSARDAGDDSMNRGYDTVEWIRRGACPEAASHQKPHDSPGTETRTKEGEETETKPQERTERACKVILFNDEEHTYDYVVEMLSHACGLTREKAFRCAVEVDLTGRTIVFYGTRPACAGVVSKIQAYGPDHRLPQSMTSMKAEIQGC